MAFNWNNFDSSFMYEIIKESELSKDERAMAEYAYSNGDKDMLISVLNGICCYPDKKFILKYRTIIEQSLLKFYKTEVNQICKTLNIQGNSYNEKQVKLTNKPLSASLIQAYIGALLNISGMDLQVNEFSKFRMTISLNMRETQIEEVPLYDFQKEAVERLREHFITENKESGIMVMPTGSGKSRTSTYFLIKEMISQGYQILWIVHRHMLIDQAADCFYKFAGLSKINNPGIRNYRISCISGEHLSIKSVDKHEVIVASISSICRNKDHLKRILGKKIMIVVDECHHTLAPTYQDTIRFIKKCRKNAKLLGITATPVRANDKGTKKLLELFDNNRVYEVKMSDLIAKGILADPQFERVETAENFEPEITIDEEKLIRRYGELPETLINKIASSNSRNQIILDKYLNNAKEYGKTLIFAMNVLHCRFLYEELEKRGVKCGLVYSGKEDNTKVITDFKDNKIDVLVNVNIMTEGTDVPDIQTVFLTRPTASEGLLMQMIGRGMRGVKANGTATVNIIDFYDKWETFNKWLNPEWLILDEKDDEEPVPERHKVDYITYEWELCREIYNSIQFRAADMHCTVSLPVGWYSLINEEGDVTRMLVFEDQVQSIGNMMKDRHNWKKDESFNAQIALEKYFRGFCSRPSIHDLNLLIENVRINEIAPQIHVLENRKSVDPYYVVQKAEEEELDIFEVGARLYEENDIVRDLYSDKNEYTMELCRVKLYQNKSHIIGIKIEELPEELIPFDRHPYYDLDELVQEVKNEMFGGVFDGISSISWTDKAYRTYYGVHHPNDHSIKINSVLNSRDVPKEVVKFVIYHELLHKDFEDHDRIFREKEHLYPKYEEWEHFLNDNMTKFDIVEW